MAHIGADEIFIFVRALRWGTVTIAHLAVSVLNPACHRACHGLAGRRHSV